MEIARLEVTFLSPAEGGRSSLTQLHKGGYSPHLRVGDGPLLGVRFLPNAHGPFVAGISSEVSVELLYESAVDYSTLTAGTEAAIVEGARAVGWAEVQ
jgi:hypothetical protein